MFSTTRASSLFVVLLATIFPGFTSAADSTYYVSIKTSIGEVTIDDNDHGDTIGTGQIIGGFVDGALEDDSIDDYTAGAGISIGRRVGYWLGELELMWRYRTDWDLAVATPSIQTITNVFSNVETTSLVFNVARRGVINQNWSWEAGAGAGLVDHDIETDYIERAVPGVSPQRTFKSSSSETDFTYSVFGGVTRALPRDWTLNVRLRYLDMGELSTGRLNGRPGRVTGEAQAVELQFALERDL